MFRAVPCSSSGGQIVLLQPLVLSLSVNGRTVCRLRAESVPSEVVEGCLNRREGTMHYANAVKYYFTRTSPILFFFQQHDYS